MRRVVALGAVLLALPLAGCGGSATHVRNICDDVTTGTRELPRYDPARPVSALVPAIGRFDLIEEAVSKARETGLPDDAAATLRRAWLDPAVTSMAGWQERLDALRAAVERGDRAGVDTAFAATLGLGTGGVDTAALRAAGYEACATAFTAPSAAALTVG